MYKRGVAGAEVAEAGPKLKLKKKYQTLASVKIKKKASNLPTESLNMSPESFSEQDQEHHHVCSITL